MSTINSTLNFQGTSFKNAATGALRESLATLVAEKIREEIISGKLTPAEMVAEIPTAERLGVSRVPVREAIFMLERDGLLVLQSNGRRHVRALSQSDFREIYSVRKMLESETFRLAAKNHTATDRAAMNANIGQMQKARTLSRISFLDVEFHDLVVNASGHTRLRHLWQVMRGQIQLFTAILQRELGKSKEEIQAITIKGHREGVEAIQSGSGLLAAKFACDHIEGWEMWIDVIASRELGS